MEVAGHRAVDIAEVVVHRGLVIGHIDPVVAVDKEAVVMLGHMAVG
jgi:hypothetical protein